MNGCLIELIQLKFSDSNRTTTDINGSFSFSITKKDSIRLGNLGDAVSFSVFDCGNKKGKETFKINLDRVFFGFEKKVGKCGSPFYSVTIKVPKGYVGKDLQVVLLSNAKVYRKVINDSGLVAFKLPKLKNMLGHIMIDGNNIKTNIQLIGYIEI